MGIASSRATNFVDNEIRSGVSVLQNIVTQNSSQITNINEVILNNCNITIDTWNLSNFAKVDMSAVTTAVMSSDLQQSVQEAIKNYADANAQGGLGIAISEGDAVTQSVVDISAAVTQAIQNSIKSITNNQNLFICNDSTVNARVINQTNITDVLTSVVTNAEQLTKVRQSTIAAITTEVKSKATGWDPTMLVALVVVIVLVGMLGGGYILTNPLMLLGLSVILTAVMGWFIKYPNISIGSFKTQVPKPLAIYSTGGLLVLDSILAVMAYRKFSPSVIVNKPSPPAAGL